MNHADLETQARRVLVAYSGVHRVHVLPVNDSAIHCASDACWCYPLTRDGVVTHNARDAREGRERMGQVTRNAWTLVGEYRKADCP